MSVLLQARKLLSPSPLRRHPPGVCPNPGPQALLTPPSGALLLGSALLQAPELFSAAVLRVPFTDALTCMMDPSLPLTEHERDEWGDPLADPGAFEAIRDMCPYQGMIGDKSDVSVSGDGRGNG